MNYLANLFTFLSLFGGFFSIIFSLERHFTFSCWSIMLAVILDGIDGQIARLNPVPSQFGKELDSLVDVVSFGIAPSILGYVFIYEHFHLFATGALFLYLVASVFRLAKYNITPKEELKKYFIGLPTTASGAIVASFILIYRRKEGMHIPNVLPDIFLPKFAPIIFMFLVLSVSFLMVSKARYLNLDGLKELMGKRTKIVILLILILIIVAAFVEKTGFALFSIFLIYLLFAPFVVKRLD